jgi:hypothetical protein
VGKYVTPVTSDWNMVSLPLKQQGDGSFGAALESLDGNYISLQTYDAGHMKPWSHWHDSKPSQMNRLTDMDHTNGYYINIQSSGHMKTLGMDHTNGYYINIQSSGHMKTLGILPSNEVISLKTGWNLVGYPSLQSTERDTALSSISGNYDAVMGMNPLTGKYIHLGPTDLMEPGNAYWIHVTTDCDLTI